MHDNTSGNLYTLANALSSISRSDTKARLRTAMVGKNLKETAAGTRAYLLQLFDEAIEITAHLPIAEDRATENIRFLVELKDSFILACSRATTAEFSTAMKLNTSLDRLYALGDAASMMPSGTTATIDRDDIEQATTDLLNNISAADWPGPAADAMRLQLTALRRILQECRYMSDDEIRKRIRQIYGDFSAEFEGKYPPDTKTRERVMAWAKRAGYGTIFALGLTADTVSVAGYIEDKTSAGVITE